MQKTNLMGTAICMNSKKDLAFQLSKEREIKAGILKILQIVWREHVKGHFGQFGWLFLTINLEWLHQLE